MDTEKHLYLSEVQKKVVHHSVGAMRVCAGAGTGKTTAMIARAIRLMEEGIAPSRILIITYSKRAADEIRGWFQGEDAPVVKTLHAIGYQIILRNQSVIGAKKLARKIKYWHDTGEFESKVILDKDFNLLDGYSTVYIAEQNGLDKLPVQFAKEKES